MKKNHLFSFLICFFLWFSSIGQTTDSESTPSGIEIPEFTMTSHHGVEISSKSTKNKVLILYFWKADCKACVSKFSELNKIYEKYADHPFVEFVSVTTEEKQTALAFLKGNTLNFPLVTGAHDIFDLFELDSLPTSLIISKEDNYLAKVENGQTTGSDKVLSHLKNALVEKSKGSITATVDGMVDKQTIFRLENGDIIHFQKAMELMDTGNYYTNKKKDESGNVYFLLEEQI